MTLPDDLMDATTPATLNGASGRRCTRHDWGWWDGTKLDCRRCGKVKDERASRRGRTNRTRGNAIEREIGHRLGLRRIGQFGTATDLDHPLWAAQVKSGSAFPERLWRWLKGVDANAGQCALLVVTDAPGPGFKRRALVILDLEDWVSLHGPTEPVA